MFGNKPKPGDVERHPQTESERASRAAQMTSPAPQPPPKPAPRGKSGEQGPPSLLSSDLFVKGNMKSKHDINVHGQVEGDIVSNVLTIGESATIRGKVIANEVIVNGRIIGELRGMRIRLNKSARVEGDIVHATIAIEAGAQFEGSVKRADDPLAMDKSAPKVPPSIQPVRQPSQTKQN